MSMKHTPGPWKVERFLVGGLRHLQKPRMTTNIFAGPSGVARGVSISNAERIVACVNACEGIADPSVVPEILRLLRVTLNREKVDTSAFYAKLADALGRAEGREP